MRVSTENDILPAAEKKAKMYAEMGLGCQPYIIGIGDSYLDLRKFFVIVENTFYSIDTFIKALDTCFKIYTVLNIEYALECEQVWIFIENFFYKLKTSKQKVSPTVSSVLIDLA